MKKNVYIKTGGDLWAIITGDDSSFIENAVINCITISKKIWPEQKIKIIGLDKDTINKLKKTLKHLNEVD